MNDLITKIKHIPYRIFVARKSGLSEMIEDKRDLDIGIFGWFEYKPKHKRKVIEDVSVKDQGSRNTCVFEATTGHKEVDEKKELWSRSIVSYAKKRGWIRGTGWTSLRSGMKALQAFGIEEYNGQIDPRSWSVYSGMALTEDLAADHKIASYWGNIKKNELYKLIDEGKTMITAINWYTGFNQGGGFKAPWIISKATGWKVGGHAFKIKGYDLNYHGKEVAICTNSYGTNWGDNGTFYIEIGYLMRYNLGIMTSLDEIDKELGKFLHEYDGCEVKTDGESTVWHIQAGKKKVYPDEISYFAWNTSWDKIKIVDKKILDRVKEGDRMDIKKSKYWEFIKHLKSPHNLYRLMDIYIKRR